MCLVHKAIYGLREGPSLWSEERTEALTNLTFASAGELYSVLLSQIHRSLCLIVRQRSLQNHTPSTDHLGLTCRAPPNEVVAMSGICVDDFLTAGPSPVVRSFLATLRKMWETSDPQYLTMDAELPFLGVSITMTKDGLLLHQHHYTLDFLLEHSSHISARKRTTSGEPENVLPPWSCHCDATALLPSQCLKNLVGELRTSPFTEKPFGKSCFPALLLRHMSLPSFN